MRYSTSIRGRELRMLDRRPDGDGAEEGSQESARSSVRNEGTRSEPARNEAPRGGRTSGGGQRAGGQPNGARAAASSNHAEVDDDFDLGSVPF